MFRFGPAASGCLSSKFRGREGAWSECLFSSRFVCCCDRTIGLAAVLKANLSAPLVVATRNAFFALVNAISFAKPVSARPSYVPGKRQASTMNPEGPDLCRLVRGEMLW